MSNYSKYGLIINPIVVDKFLPYIGPTAYAIYSFYLLKYNPKVKGAYPSMRTTAKHIGCSTNTVSKYNTLLEKCGLIEIQYGSKRIPNLYVPLKPDIRILEKVIKEYGNLCLSSCDTKPP